MYVQIWWKIHNWKNIIVTLFYFDIYNKYILNDQYATYQYIYCQLCYFDYRAYLDLNLDTRQSYWFVPSKRRLLLLAFYTPANFMTELQRIFKRTPGAYDILELGTEMGACRHWD